MTRPIVGIRLALLTAVAAMPLAAAHAADVPPERFELGLNSSGYTCAAARQWKVGEGVLRAKDQPFAITCRGLSAADAQGYISAPNAKVDLAQCGEPLAQRLPGIGQADVRRCFDAELGRPAIDIRFSRGGVAYHGAAVETAVGPLELALRTIATGAAAPSGRSEAKSTVELARIPAAPAASVAARSSGITAEAALVDGIAALQAGRLLDASRILNDAIRVFVSAEPGTRIDLRLAASLADSGLSRFDTAAGHLAVAQTLLDTNPSLADVDYRLQQLATYRGIHLINQRRWSEAIEALSRQGGGGKLLDAAIVSRLNQEAIAEQDSLQPALADTTSFSRDLLEAQRQWALSVAYLALGRVEEADGALSRAVLAARHPVQAALPERIVWLLATIERQKGRIEAQKGRYDAALASFDCAIGALKGVGGLGGGRCLVPADARLPDSAINAPLLVEAQLERASIASRDRSNAPEAVLAQYSAAVESLPILTGTGFVSLAALERYFGLLVRAPQSPNRDEEFFRAMQAIGEPAIAREVAQLQKVVSASADVSNLLRRRSDLERQLIRLRTAITEASSSSAAELPSLERERNQANAELTEVNAKLQSADGIGALEDQPATLADIRNALQPGEVYLKLTAMRSAMFGIAISRDRTLIYQLEGSLPQISSLATRVLASARSDANRTIRPFDVPAANRLFDTVAGPAADMIRSAQRLIYNPAGTLRHLPAAIMVTDPETVRAYQEQRNRGDYSMVAFLGARSEVATALSPRAFLRSRKEIAPSNAPRPFLGLGENALPEIVGDTLAEQPMPFDCSLTWRDWAREVAARQPVSAREIGIAAAALGVSGAPQIVGASFTDTGLLAGTAGAELSQYQILHFATHGIPETTVDVDECRMRLPPSLVTTLAAPTSDGQVVSDGLLAFDEVARLRLDANLIVLSACETSAGTSEATAGRGGLEGSDPALDGLVRSFLAGGARSVLATFWSVPAIPQSDELMAAFYRTGRSASMSGALKAAQATLINQPRFSHPYFWGAYFLVGDGSKPMLSGQVQLATR